MARGRLHSLSQKVAQASRLCIVAAQPTSRSATTVNHGESTGCAWGEPVAPPETTKHTQAGRALNSTSSSHLKVFSVISVCAVVNPLWWRQRGAVHNSVATGCLLLIAAMLITTLAGCDSNKQFLNENDQLRERIAHLEAQLQIASRRAEELDAQLRKLAGEYPAVSEDVLVNTPQLAEITIGRLSHVRDTDDDGRADVVMVYVGAVDGRSRPLQIVGEMTVTVRLASRVSHANTPSKQDEQDEPEYEPSRILGATSLDPTTLREAYRAGFTGTHYTVEVPIEPFARASNNAIHISVTFLDGYTEKSYTAERVITLRQPELDKPAV